MSMIAHDYVHLVLALGQHDKDYVDAYYGPPEIKKELVMLHLVLREAPPQASFIPLRGRFISPS